MACNHTGDEAKRASPTIPHGPLTRFLSEELEVVFGRLDSSRCRRLSTIVVSFYAKSFRPIFLAFLHGSINSTARCGLHDGAGMAQSLVDRSGTL